MNTNECARATEKERDKENLSFSRRDNRFICLHMFQNDDQSMEENHSLVSRRFYSFVSNY